MKKVLFVDDEHDYVNIVRHYFPKDEIALTFANTAARGLKELKTNRFDAIVIDLMMFIDGVLFLKLAKDRLRDSKIYFISALDKRSIETITDPVKERITGIYSKDEIANLKHDLLK